MPVKALLHRLLVAGRHLHPAGRPRVVVLCYHSVHPSLPYRSVDPARFAGHLAWLTAHADVIPFAGALAAAADPHRTRPAVALTFDDGYADNAEVALPLLEAAGCTATFFLTAGLLDGDPAVRERFARVRGEPVRPLSWAQAEELAAAGQDVGAHTWSHPNLAHLGAAALRDELGRSKAVLEDRLGRPVPTLAYPFGKPGRHVTPAVRRAAAEAGYTHAAAVQYRRVRPADDPLLLPRFFITGDDLPTLDAKVRGAWDVVGRWQQHAPRPLARLVAPKDFSYR